MRPKIVHDDDIAGLECRDEDLFDTGQEGFAIDGAIQHEGRDDRVVAERGQKRQSSSNGRAVTLATSGWLRGASARAGHVGLGPGLINKNKAGWINPGLVFFPAQAAPGDVGAILLGGEQGFF